MQLQPNKDTRYERYLFYRMHHSGSDSITHNFSFVRDAGSNMRLEIMNLIFHTVRQVNSLLIIN